MCAGNRRRRHHQRQRQDQDSETILGRLGRHDDEREETCSIQLLSTRTYTVIHCQFPLRRGYSHSLPREGHGSLASPPCSVTYTDPTVKRTWVVRSPTLLSQCRAGRGPSSPRGIATLQYSLGVTKEIGVVKQKKSFPPPQSRDGWPDQSISIGGMAPGYSDGDAHLYLPHLVCPADRDSELRHVLLPAATAQSYSAQHLLHLVEKVG